MKAALVSENRQFFRLLGVRAVVSSGFVSAALAQTPVNSTFSINPPLSEPAKTHPMVMLTLSGDHQVFMKAYNDFDDLDGDDLPDVTYNHNVVYKGYFNEEKCYSYGSGVFTPAADAAAPAATDNGLGIKEAALAIKQYCANSKWSGNFLNWATMTRIDIVRGVLYGGKRSTDTSSSTVLERAYLPNDSHSFAKYYNGSDLNKLTAITNYVNTDASDARKVGLTFCNTSTGHEDNKVSQSQTNTVPTMRVVKGNYSLWASGERYQCLLGYDASNNKEFDEYAANVFGVNGNDSSITGIQAYSDVPYGKTRAGTHWLGDYTVRVAVCTDAVEDNIHYCRRYGTSYKPTGLLQTYGIHADNPVLFGLMTGAVNKNKSAGVLRKNVSSMADEVSTTDGTFLKPNTGSIIASIDAMMLLDYHFRKVVGTDFNYTGNYQDTCPWFRYKFDEGKCRNWGNPFSEILAESYRYLAGNNNQPTLSSQERTNETSSLSGSTAPSWQDPFSATGVTHAACVNLNVLGINSSSSSYDSDLGTTGTAPNLTPRTFANLGITTSTQTLNQWTDLVGSGELNTNKKYFIGSNGGTNDGQCTPKSITSLSSVTGTCPEAPRLAGSYLAAGLAYYVKANNIRPDKTTTTGKVYNVNTLGLTLAGTQPIIKVPGTNVKIIPACRNNSYDPVNTPQDKIGNCALVGFRPVYTTNGQMPTKYFVTWEDTEQGSDFDQDINGIIEYSKVGNSVTVTAEIFKSSTTANVFFGFIISGTTNDGLKLPTQINPNVLEESLDFTVGSSDALPLEPPLYYATKWGSYTNSLEDNDPKFNPAKDTWTEDGATPANYAYVTNPNSLRENLGNILVKIGKNSATGTAAPVSINSLTGEGIFLQTVYQPAYVSPDGSSSTSWVGTLSALFIDRYGNIREDSNSDQKLDNGDKVIEFVKTDFRFQNSEEVTEERKVIGFNRYPYSAAKKGKDESNSSAVELAQKLDKLKTMWNARDQLAAITDANIGLQRGTTDAVGQKRLILTGIDKPNASNQYDTLYGDDSYTAFRNKYAKRRNMVYVGANDGMLHAFNAGFFDPLKTQYTNTPTGNDVSKPALGAEMWAYIPYNLLPHLKWLTRKNYEHVYYVDASVKVFDANIFASKNNAEKYPHGWGTILVVGMRYGGGDYTVTRTTTDKPTLRSAYALFDITDPEAAPELIAEVTSADMGYTLAEPEIIKRRKPNANGSYTSDVTVNDWYLVFGSGPKGGDAVKKGISNTAAKLFYLDLKNAVSGTVSLNSIAADATSNRSFVGGVTAKDWNKDFHDDMLYFGLVGDDNRGSNPPTPLPAAYKGALRQAVVAGSGTPLSDGTVKSLLSNADANLPFSSAPLTVRDGAGKFWVFAGTGRFLVSDDLNLSSQNYYFGLKVNDPGTNPSKPWRTDSGVALSSLQDVTNHRLYVNSAGGLIVRDASGNRTLNKYLEDIASKSGWYRGLTATKEANFTRSAFFEGTLIFNSYKPSLNTCEIGGDSPQYLLDMFTGLPQYRLKTLFKGTDTLTHEAESYTEVVPKAVVIDGIASAPVIANSRAISQSSNATLKATDVTPAAIKPVRKGWREIFNDELR